MSECNTLWSPYEINLFLILNLISYVTIENILDEIKLIIPI